MKTIIPAHEIPKTNPRSKKHYPKHKAKTFKATSTNDKEFGAKEPVMDKAMVDSLIASNNRILKSFIDNNIGNFANDSGEIIGSSIPMVYNFYGSWLINPSTISIETFQRMTYSDPVITSALEYNSSVISNTIGEYFHEDSEIQDFVRKSISKLEGNKKGLIRNMLTAMWAGFAVGEKVYSEPEEFIDGKMWIKRVVPLPPSTILFRADIHGTLVPEIYQYVYFANYPGYQNMLSELTFDNGGACATAPPDALSYAGDMPYPVRTATFQAMGLVAIPKSKTIHFVRKGQDGFENPYGRSMLRAAYNFFILKCAYLQFLAIAGDKKSLPLLVAYVDPNALTSNVPISPEAPDALMQPGGVEVQEALSAVTKALNMVRGDTGLVLPGMKGAAYDLEAIHIEGNTDLFLNALNYLDDQIQKSLFFPSSILGGGDGASFAMGTNQSTIQNKLLSAIRNDIMDCLIKDYVSDLIESNFLPEKYNKFVQEFGYFEPELMNTEDKINVAKLYEAKRNSGLTSASIRKDIDTTRQVLGDAPLTDEEFSALQKDFENMNPQKTNVKEVDSHYKKQNDKPQGGST
jgi:hypothetical protein